MQVLLFLVRHFQYVNCKRENKINSCMLACRNNFVHITYGATAMIPLTIIYYGSMASPGNVRSDVIQLPVTSYAVKMVVSVQVS